MIPFNFADIRSSLGSQMSPIFSSRASSSGTANSSANSSPLIFDSGSISSPRLLEHNPQTFPPIDSSQDQTCRPVFENPRPAPIPPREWQQKSLLPPFRISSLPPSSSELVPTTPGSEGDVCEDAEDFLQFLARSGFIAAERRSSSIHRSSFYSGTSRSGSRPTSMQSSSRPASMHSNRPGSDGFNLQRPPSSLVVNSRRTSLAHHRGSSGVIPPILQNDTCRASSVSISIAEPTTPPRQFVLPHQTPPMRREDNLSKLMSDFRLSSDFTPSESPVPAPAVDEPNVFLARRKSSVDFSEIEVLLGRARNPVLIQLHKAYTQQFELMAHQIASLTRELSEQKRIQNQSLQFEKHIQSPDNAADFREIKSQSLPDGRESRLSTISTPQKSTSIDVCPPETPFWKTSLAQMGEEWDNGDGDGPSRESMRCVSPLTVR